MTASNSSARGGRVGSRLGRLLLTERVGYGGFAVVYRARDESFDTDVAVKVLAENHSLDPDMRRRFLDEARLLRRVQNPALVQVHDIGETDDLQPYLVLEYAAGGTLQDRISARREVTQEDLRALLSTLHRGLGALHAVGIVHRDVSPANIFIRATTPIANPNTSSLLDAGEELVLGDLGLAKDLREASGITAAAGTPKFAAPEQRVLGSSVGPPADVYGASALLSSVAKGTRFQAAIQQATERGHHVDPDQRPSLDEWARLVDRSLDDAAATSMVASRLTTRMRALAGAFALIALIASIAGFSQLRGAEQQDSAAASAPAPATTVSRPTPEESSPADTTGNGAASNERPSSTSVIEEGRLDVGWYDESWGVQRPLDATGAIELTEFGALSLIAADSLVVQPDSAVVIELRGDATQLAVRANDAQGEALTPCALAGSTRMVSVNADGSTRIVVPLNLLDVADGSLSRISLQDQSGVPTSFSVNRLAFESAAGIGSTPSCGP